MFLSSIGETITGSRVDDKFRVKDDSWAVSYSKPKQRMQNQSACHPSDVKVCLLSAAFQFGLCFIIKEGWVRGIIFFSW